MASATNRLGSSSDSDSLVERSRHHRRRPEGKRAESSSDEGTPAAIQRASARIEADRIRTRDIDRIERVLTKFVRKESHKNRAFRNINLDPGNRALLYDRFRREIRAIVSKPNFGERCLDNDGTYEKVKVTNAVIDRALRAGFERSTRVERNQIKSQLKEYKLDALYPRQAPVVYNKIQELALAAIDRAGFVDTLFSREEEEIRLKSKKVAGILRRTISEINGRQVNDGPFDDSSDERRGSGDLGVEIGLSAVAGLAWLFSKA